jgi:hypothetical protein
MTISDMIVELHKLANSCGVPLERYNIILLANELAKIGNRLHERETND